MNNLFALFCLLCCFFSLSSFGEEAQRSPALLSLSSFDDEEAERSPALFKRSIEVGLEFPLNIGIHGRFRWNRAFYTRTGVGFVSEYFLGTFSRLAPKLGYVNQYESDLIADVIKNSLYLDFRVGYFPYSYFGNEGGPYVEVGASGMLFGGGFFDDEEKGGTSGFTLNEAIGVGDAVRNYYIKSNVYNVTFHVGYQIPFEDHLRLNLDLGVVKIVYAKVGSQTSELGESLTDEEDKKKLQKFLLKKGWIFPTLSIWLSFKF